jgi:hypothetical protein
MNFTLFYSWGSDQVRRKKNSIEPGRTRIVQKKREEAGELGPI